MCACVPCSRCSRGGVRGTYKKTATCLKNVKELGQGPALLRAILSRRLGRENSQTAYLQKSFLSAFAFPGFAAFCVLAYDAHGVRAVGVRGTYKKTATCLLLPIKKGPFHKRAPRKTSYFICKQESLLQIRCKSSIPRHRRLRPVDSKRPCPHRE